MLTTHLSQIRSQTPVKVFFSSRPSKAITRFDPDQIKSYFLREEDTIEDIRRYTSSVVRQALPDDAQLLDYIVDQTLKNSSGSFLWVKLALDALQENWHTQDDIRAVLTELPNGMIPMYERMLSRIESRIPRSRNMARRILTWATCSWRPLRVDELQVALEPEFSNFINLEETVTQICGHFITTTRTNPVNQVSLIHKTVRDFLSKSNAGTVPYIDTQQGHRHLAMVCLKHLSSDHWRRHFDSIHVTTRPQVQRGLANISNRLRLAENGHPLLGYSACYWAYHVSKSPLDEPELLDTLKTFFSKYCLSWIEAIALSGNLRYLIRSAQYLKAYVKRHLQSPGFRDRDHPITPTLEGPPEHDVEWIQSWAVDLIRVVGKFGSGLLCDPPSVYRQLPSFCPKNSMIGKTYGSSRQELLTVVGLTAEIWDDCLASVSVGKDEDDSRVLATETYFITMASTTGIVMVWSAETCEQMTVIRTGGYVRLMVLNRAGTAVATVALDTYDVWELSTGSRLYTCAASPDDITLDLGFGVGDSELVVGLDNNNVRRIDLKSGKSIDSPITLPADPDFSYQGCPWCMALSPDLTKIAVAWRGRPPLIWDILPGSTHRPRKCRVSSPTDSICAPELLRWHPDAESLFVLCQDTNIVEWRIFEDGWREYSHLNAREMIISDDGNYLLSSDHAGTISIWTIPRLNLVYSLINEGDCSSDLAFSPGCQRFYDVRGSACNVWEPDALVRADEQDLEDKSSTGGTTILTEPTISNSSASGKPVTALALDAEDKYYCRGKEGGRVTIHDATTGKRLRNVYNHWALSSVVAICWSGSGKYITSCDDGAFVITKRLRVKEEGTWAVFPVFDYRLEEAVEQFLFSADEQHLLISTPTADHVWDLRAKKEVNVQKWPERRNLRWIQHPLQPQLLVCVSPTTVRCHKWPTLEASETSLLSGLSSQTPCADGLEASTSSHPGQRSTDQSRHVSWASVSTDKRAILYATLPSDGSLVVPCMSHGGLHIELVDALNILQGSSQSATTRCVSSVAEQVKLLLGLYKTSIVFIDHECWLCTWDTQDETGRLTRHFFIPKDWLNTSTSHMAMVNSRGTFFCPRYGDVAIVRDGIRI